MATIVSWNGSSFTVPATSEENWGGVTKVDGLLVSLAQNGLQKSGGLFTLSADLDFGAAAGLKSIYYKSRATNPATTGIVRHGNNELDGWRDAGNATNYTFGLNSSDLFEWKAGGGSLGSITSGGLWTLANSTVAPTHLAYGSLTVQKSSSGSIATILANHTSNTSGSSSLIQANVAGSSGGDPYLHFVVSGATDWTFGVDNSDSDKLKICQSNAIGTSDFFSVTVGGLFTIGAASGSQVHAVNGSLQATYTSAGNTATVGMYNTDNSSGSSHARMQSTVGGASGGDPYISFSIAGVQDWVAGVDNSDSDKFKISASSSLGSTDVYTCTISQQHTFTGIMGIGGGFSTDTVCKISGSAAGTDQNGLYVGVTASSACTGGFASVRSQPTTAASVFTCPYVLSFFAPQITKGATSTITRIVNFFADDQVDGTNNAHMTNNVTFTGNWYINYSGTRPSLMGSGSLIVGTAELATGATDGFIYIPTMNGTPTGNSTDYTGTRPIVFDRAANKLWINTTGTTWVSVTLA